MRWRRVFPTAVVPVLTASAIVLAWTAGCGREASQRTEESAASGEEEAKGAIAGGGVPMVRVEGGEFLMGDAAGDDTAPAHRVSVSSFEMDKFEVTQELYEKITGRNPSRHKGQQNPVERVRWREAIAFCNARSEAEHRRPCYDLKSGKCDFAADGYRLPTEAEWEFACRGGTRGAYYFGGDARPLKGHAWFKDNADHAPHPVGQLRANPLGLCDMAGNVWEWCNDWYQVDYYENSPPDNPRGPDQGEKKSLRGGGFTSKSESCACAARNCDDPGFADACVASDDFGFRCVRRPR